jgi:hypothetical protein
MWPFNALIDAVLAPLSYLSTKRNSPVSKDPSHTCALNFEESDRAFAFALTTNPQTISTPFEQSCLSEDSHSGHNTLDPARILTILWGNHPMAPSLKPIFPCTMYPAASGRPVRFHIGNSHKPFDVHSTILVTASSAFESFLEKPLTGPIILRSISPEDFITLIQWLYDSIPPTFPHPQDLFTLVKLWTVAAQLGLWRKANTLMRIGMETMHPASAKCDINILRWVFANTPASSPLRDYIIAIFTQRSDFDESVFHTTGPEDSEIWSKTAAFMKKLEVVRGMFGRWRGGSAWSMDANGLPLFNWEVARDWKEGQGKYALPPYLVWDENAADVPDCFFLLQGTVAYEEGLAHALKM